MDMDIEVEEFKKRNAPSLIGSSIRDSSDKLPTLKALGADGTNSSYVKSESTSDLVPVSEIIREGGLNADEEDEELDDVLDKEGHVKKELIFDAKASNNTDTRSYTKSITPSELEELNIEEEKIDDGNKETILGGDADKYLAPAGGASSDYKYPLKKKKGTDLTQLDDSNTFIEPDKMRSVDDIINVVNKGDFEKASTLIDDNVAKSICLDTKNKAVKQVNDVHEPVVPDSAIEVDSEFTAPAAMREGSESRLLEEQRSRSLSRYGNSSSRSNASGERPNLARGESIHSGLNGDLSITNTYDQTSHSLVSERRPRHDPSGPKISNSSSLNYLRSISRSRSRMANDRRALGEEHLDSKDLRESGALINDDSMSNRSDIEYAVNKALDFVEDTHSVKGGKKISDGGDIVKNLQKGLAEVAEEEQASNRKDLNSSDLLDQLANSAMELMLDDDDAEETDEEGEMALGKEHDNVQNSVLNDTSGIQKPFDVHPPTADTHKTEVEHNDEITRDEKSGEEISKKTDDINTPKTEVKQKNGIQGAIEKDKCTKSQSLHVDEATFLKNEPEVEPSVVERQQKLQEDTHIDLKDHADEEATLPQNQDVLVESSDNKHDAKEDCEEGMTLVNETKNDGPLVPHELETASTSEEKTVSEEKMDDIVEVEEKATEVSESVVHSSKGGVSDLVDSTADFDTGESTHGAESKNSLADTNEDKSASVTTEHQDDDSDTELAEDSEKIKKEEASVEDSAASAYGSKVNAANEPVDKPHSGTFGKDVEQNDKKNEEHEQRGDVKTTNDDGVNEKILTETGENQQQEKKAIIPDPEKAVADSIHADHVAADKTPAVEKETDDTDALIAAAVRENALKEKYNPMGNDGSVFVPKVEKMTFEDEPVYLYTSFAGGFQVTTRTNRLITILTANRIKFEYRDLGTDEEAKKVWRRYSAGKSLPGIVRGKDDFIGNWQDMEEANEDYRVRSLIYETY